MDLGRCRLSGLQGSDVQKAAIGPAEVAVGPPVVRPLVRPRAGEIETNLGRAAVLKTQEGRVSGRQLLLVKAVAEVAPRIVLGELYYIAAPDE